MEKRVVWTTDMVTETEKKIDDGFILPGYLNPFFEGTVGLRKPKLSFKLTTDEYNEYVACKLDVKYFANNYCFVKSDDGKFSPIRLRDYQHDMLDLYDNNRKSILMASRQVGKCVDYTTEIDIRTVENGNYNVERIPVFELWWRLSNDVNILDICKYITYKVIYKLNRLKNNIENL